MKKKRTKKNPLLPVGGHWKRHELSIDEYTLPNSGDHVYAITQVTHPAYDNEAIKVVRVDTDSGGDYLISYSFAQSTATSMATAIIMAEPRNPNPVVVHYKGREIITATWDSAYNRVHIH